MGSCRVCGRGNVDTRNGICGDCMGQNTRRTRRNKNVIKLTSIIVGIIIIGFFVYQNNGLIFNKIQTEVPKIEHSYTKPLLAKISSLSANLSQVTSNSNIQLTPPPSLDQLQQTTLDDLNKYRQANNVLPLKMLNESPTQTYAELLLSERCLHHMNADGLTPQGRFHQAGIDSFAVGENIAGGQKAVLENLEGFIKNQNHEMMFNDASSDWGHRDNILDSRYVSISIGIAYDATNMIIVEDFESPLQGGEYIPSSEYYDTPDSKECW